MNGGNKVKKFYEFKLNENEKTADRYYRGIKKITEKYGEDFLDKFDNPILLEEVIAEQKPQSLAKVSVIMSIIKNYAQFLDNNNAVRNIRMIDRNVVWDKAKVNNNNVKYIPHEMYEQMLFDIEMNEEYNSLFYVTLLECLYEGIYSEDMTVLDNLRACDVNGNIITLRPKSQNEYSIKVSDELVRNMKELSMENTYFRKTGQGMLEFSTMGLFEDSVFKFENRSKGDKKESYKFSFYNRIRRITKDYIGNTVSPKNIFLSGLMYRVTEMLKKENIPVEEFIKSGRFDFEVSRIMSKELKRCNCNLILTNFRQYLRQYHELANE